MVLFQRRLFRLWYKWDFIYQFSSSSRREKHLLKNGYAHLRQIKKEKAIEIEENLKRGVDILENSRKENTVNWIQKCFLLQREGQFDDENVAEQIDTVYVGGSDTSMVTAVSTIVMLAIHQEAQDRVVEELRDIFGADTTRPITNEDLTKMTYLEMVIKESLRHFPVGPFIGRECSKDMGIANGTIPKGATVILNVLKLHKNPDIWGPNVDRFYPEHFLPDVISKMHPFSYLAFSAGPRNCVGMSDFICLNWNSLLSRNCLFLLYFAGIKYGYAIVKMTIAYILREYKMTSHLKLADIKTTVNIILKIANERPVKFEKRNKL